MLSRLNTILVVSLFYAEDRKEFGNNAVFKHSINELNDLRRDGILINVNGKEYRVRFQLGLVLGNNLGVNGVLGLAESFASGKP